jgi:hypothetical protein
MELGSPAQSEKWQKQYYRDITPDDSSAPEDHRTPVRLNAFAGVAELDEPEPTSVGLNSQGKITGPS